MSTRSPPGSRALGKRTGTRVKEMKDKSATVSVGLPADLLRRHIPDVEALVDLHPGILAELRDQLAVPHVHRHHVCRTVPEQHLSETAGGGAGVQTPLSAKPRRRGTPSARRPVCARRG